MRSRTADVRVGQRSDGCQGFRAADDDLRLGFVVTGRLLDGMADHERVRLFVVEPDGQAAVISLEDMIADRVGQYTSGTAPDMLEQARVLFALYPDADLHSLERRVRYESGGDLGLEVLTS